MWDAGGGEGSGAAELCWGCLVRGRRLSSLQDTGLENVYMQLLTEIPMLELDGAAIHICWECRAGLRRTHNFKRRVEASYRTLSAYLAQDGSLSNCAGLSRPVVLRTHRAYAHEYPEWPLGEDAEPPAARDTVKCERWDVDVEENKLDVNRIKTELEEDAFCEAEQHYSEPETFADSIRRGEPEESKPAAPAPASAQQDKRKRGKHKKIKKERKKPKGRMKKSETKPARRSRGAREPADDASVATADLEVSSDGLTDLESVVDYYKDPPAAAEKPVKEKLKPVKKEEKAAYDPTEIKLITLTHEEMLREREREAAADYFVKSAHKCTDCLLGFKYERTLRTHVETKHDRSAGEHPCAVCRVRFADAAQVGEHARRHLQRYKCTVCGKKSPALLPMLKHVRNHKEYKCDVCGQVSGSLFRHQTHMAKEHKEKPQCVECSKFFSSRKTYRYHMNVIHKGQNRFPCPHCGKIYQWKSNLWRHIKNHKARDNGELHCAPCNKKFSSIATYQQHMKISRKHVTENEFKLRERSFTALRLFSYMCSECGKKFANKTRLRDHVDWEHLKKINYRCQLCNKPFKSNTSLYVHMQNVHKNKDEKDNLCHVCGKSYQNIAKLKYHIVAMHTTETPYSCEQCPSAFSWYSSLYRHVKEVHDKVRVKKKRTRRKEGAPPLHPPPPHMQQQHV